MTTENLLIELLVEELPPKALSNLGHAFAVGIQTQLNEQGLLEPSSHTKAFATPRRLAVLVTQVLARATTQNLQHKLMPVAVGLNAQGQATPALLKKLQALGVAKDAMPETLAKLERRQNGKNDMLFLHTEAAGVLIEQGAQNALNHALAHLPIPKVMTYQLGQDCALPGWDSVQFVRPAHALIALYGERVLELSALGLRAGHETQGHRFEAQTRPITVPHADAYEATLEKEGAVVAGFAKRQKSIQEQLQAKATALGLQLEPDQALLEEVTALVERPNVLLCQFDAAFLRIPKECLILTMKANQKYFPLFTSQGKLSNHFLLVSNISPADPSQVIAGNERVVRPRLADAQFFYEQDLKKTLASRIPDLQQVVYHHQLGSQAQRSERVAAIGVLIVEQLLAAQTKYDADIRSEMEMLAFKVQQAASLAKCDLLTGMVGEFPELQGIMGAYYARHEGLKEGVAIAIEDHYKPRFAGDALPRKRTATVLALADKLETLVGMFGIGNLPSGDKDPYALRRHALGVLRIVLEKDLPLNLKQLVAQTSMVFDGLIVDEQATTQAVSSFMLERLSGLLREQGYDSNAVEAVVAVVGLECLHTLEKRLQAIRSFLGMEQAQALIAANKRITNILKKSDADQAVGTVVSPHLLQPGAEQNLHLALQDVLPQVEAAMQEENHSQALQVLAQLKEPVDVFFEKVMVNDPDPDLRANRLVLLRALYQTMNQVADISRLAAVA